MALTKVSRGLLSTGIVDNSNATAITIDSSENVGIGTSSPSSLLHLDGAESAAGGLTLSAGGQQHQYFLSSDFVNVHNVATSSSAAAHTWQLNGTERMRLDASGNLLAAGTAKAEFLTTVGDSLWFLDDTNATANSYINYYGYNHGVTQFRNLYIADGKGATVLRLFGSSKAVHCYGAFSKASGSFKIDHPLPEKTETHHLVHSFVESPQANNIYRGKVDLIDGSATVNVDDAAGMTEGTYVLLNTNTQCFTSNESGWTAVKGSVSGNILTITAQESCSDTISWMVIGERHDQHMLDTDWTDDNGKVIVEPLKLDEEE